MTVGVLMVAYGDRAIASARHAAGTLAFHVPDMQLVLFSDRDLRLPHTTHSCSFLTHYPDDHLIREAKLQANLLSPFDQTIYLDADTTVHGPLDSLLAPLHDGWDMVMTTSVNQDRDLLLNLDHDERMDARLRLGDGRLGLQCGVMAWQKNDATDALFAAWRTHWNVHRRHDQGAFLMALDDAPVLLWLVGRPFNGGAVIDHHFGKARG
jgi:hypothetical protein